MNNAETQIEIREQILTKLIISWTRKYGMQVEYMWTKTRNIGAFVFPKAFTISISFIWSNLVYRLSIDYFSIRVAAHTVGITLFVICLPLCVCPSVQYSHAFLDIRTLCL